jgi:hypothetical protein
MALKLECLISRFKLSGCSIHLKEGSGEEKEESENKFQTQRTNIKNERTNLHEEIHNKVPRLSGAQRTERKKQSEDKRRRRRKEAETYQGTAKISL